MKPIPSQADFCTSCPFHLRNNTCYIDFGRNNQVREIDLDIAYRMCREPRIFYKIMYNIDPERYFQLTDSLEVSDN